MTLHLWLSNLAGYSAQIALLGGVGSLAPVLLRVWRPQVMLLYLQLLLAACLALPILQPWHRPVADRSGGVSISTSSIAAAAAPARHLPSLEEGIAFVLGSGVLLRVGWLAIGLLRLRRYRRSAQMLAAAPRAFDDLLCGLAVQPSIGLSAAVRGPVTFGIRNPVILLPFSFLTLPEGARRAIACHEVAHVRRGDWAFTVLEEIVRAAFWFHPCIWWLLSRIQLTREQAVDREVIEITASREQYIDALLVVAGVCPQPDLAPAPSFLQRSHLTQRVALILKEASMSRKRLLCSLAAMAGALAVTVRLAVLCFPISAPAQEVIRGESHLLHRMSIEYPAGAIDKGVQGTVVVEATLNERGVVTDARAVSGPQELRKAALKSVLEWHYSGQAQSPVEVAIDFKLPAKRRGVSTNLPGGVTGGVAGGATSGVSGGVTALQSGSLSRIQMAGVSPQLREALEGRIPVHIGDELQPDTISRVRQAVRDVDEHLDARLSPTRKADGSIELALTVFSSAPMAASTADSTPQRIRVGGNVQATQQISAPKPVYPPMAKQARIQGVVRLNVTINRDGTVQDVQVVSGHPLLMDVAMDAVRQWVYRPTLLNGEPVEVQTVVDVNFTLATVAPQAQ
ncbi:MAG TPA: M56 family metallopeptidase [Bryobacteraceae bacterium]|nr:M56 family metallopeptidase [Bryobacteraceae bacterium]